MILLILALGFFLIGFTNVAAFLVFLMVLLNVVFLFVDFANASAKK